MTSRLVSTGVPRKLPFSAPIKLDALLTKYPRFKDYIYVEDGLLRFQLLGFSPDHADRILALFSDELLNEIEADEDEDED